MQAIDVQQAPATPAQLPQNQPASASAAGLVAVTADNSSLNQILRAVSQQTGITITGGVNDERVYGNYGPAAPADVLSQLLDGTGVNMMLVQPSGASPAQLILTQRNGGPTPRRTRTPRAPISAILRPSPPHQQSLQRSSASQNDPRATPPPQIFANHPSQINNSTQSTPGTTAQAVAQRPRRRRSRSTRSCSSFASSNSKTPRALKDNV